MSESEQTSSEEQFLSTTDQEVSNAPRILVEVHKKPNYRRKRRTSYPNRTGKKKEAEAIIFTRCCRSSIRRLRRSRQRNSSSIYGCNSQFRSNSKKSSIGGHSSHAYKCQFRPTQTTGSGTRSRNENLFVYSPERTTGGSYVCSNKICIADTRHAR